MSAFFKAELKDKFLEYALERDDYFEVQLLYDEFLRPNYSLEYVQRLIREIMDFNPELLDIMSGNGAKIFMVSATASTEEFLENGAFKGEYIQEEEKWDAFLEQLSNTRKLSTQEKVNLGHTEKKRYTRERLLLMVLIAAVAISFVYSLFGILSPLFKKKQDGNLEEIEQRLDALETRNLELQTELDSLQYQYKNNLEK